MDIPNNLLADTQSVIIGQEFYNLSNHIFDIAKKNIKIVTFKLQPPSKKRSRRLEKWYGKLFAARERGLDIKIITNLMTGHHYSAVVNTGSAMILKEKGISVKGATGTRIIHAKYILIDRQYAIVGSHNITERAFSSNYEVSIFTTNQGVIEPLEQSFNKEWNGLPQPHA